MDKIGFRPSRRHLAFAVEFPPFFAMGGIDGQNPVGIGIRLFTWRDRDVRTISIDLLFFYDLQLGIAWRLW